MRLFGSLLRPSVADKDINELKNMHTVMRPVLQDAIAQQYAQNAAAQNAAAQNALGNYGNMLGKHQNYVRGVQTPPTDFECGALKLNILEAAEFWETRFGDAWVDIGVLEEDYQIVYQRLSRRVDWFETYHNRVRLVPKELRK